MPRDGDITGLLARVRDGDELAIAELYPLVERVLRDMVRKRKHWRGTAAHEIPTTMLIDEAFLQNVVAGEASWERVGRRTFYSFAARTIEDMLIAESRKRIRRESLLPRVSLDDADNLGFLRRGLENPDFLLDLKEKLAALEARSEEESQAAVVFRMKCFLGCKLTEIAEVLGFDYKRVVKQYAVALTWIRLQLQEYSDAGE